ncbi:cation:proton antiporter [Sphingobium nicotianae]|uniref:cation:proton antiporter domain-containing protein n=1 Tax=Sphingobium nicotianae TaxID=2782607 RepID=UPI0032D8D24E
MADPVPAISATELLLSEGVILLGVALTLVLIFRRLGLGATLGYLVSGALVGPHGFALVGGGQSKMDTAEIGIVLLLFLVGLELNPQRLWRLRHDIFGLGVLQVTVCGVALAGLIFGLTGFSGGAAIALGLPLALSSTAQVLPSLKASGRINSPFGEKAFAILLLQDLAIVPMITIIASLSRAPAEPNTPPGWTLALYTLGAIVGLVFAGRFVLRPLLRLVGRLGERELFVAVGLFAVLASASLMHALHLSAALGAFIAGVMLADSPYRHEIESDVEPFRTILLGLFFVAVGMVLDLGVIARAPFFIIGMALLLVAVKVALITALGLLFRMPRGQALALGLLLSQGGEFAFVLFSQAQSALLVAPAAASTFSAIVTVSMMTTPFLLMIARRLEFSKEEGDVAGLDGPEMAARGATIIVGYGRFGQTVAQMLMGQGCKVTLIDKKPAQIEISGQFNIKVYYGDGTRIDLLRLAGAEQANLLIFAHDDHNFSAAALAPIQEAFPQIGILVRVFDRRQLLDFNALGNGAVTREVFESAVTMGRTALDRLGLTVPEIDEVERQYRANDQARLDVQLSAGVMAAGDLLYRPGRTMILPEKSTIGDDA